MTFLKTTVVKYATGSDCKKMKKHEMTSKSFTKENFLTYLAKTLSTMKTDQQMITLFLNSYKEDAKLSKLDFAHLDWEVTHMNNSYEELKHDIQRVISTLEGKGFNAGTDRM